MKYAKSVVDLIGNTPLVMLNNISKSSGANVFGKCEFLNPTSSVKDRISLNMIEEAINRGEIKESTEIIEPTSGNTGIGLAALCASKGLKLVLTMPSSMSLERRKLLHALGAKLVLTPPEKGMKGAVEKAIELKKESKNSIILQQFENSDNKNMHIKTTAKEIWNDTDGKIDIFVASVGTGGTISGVGEYLKEMNENIQIVAVEPTDSPVLSGGAGGPHKIQGIGAGFIPKILNTTIYDEIIKVTNQDAYIYAKEIAKNEGLVVGISSGANIYATNLIASRSENSGKNIVTILCDTGERYLSTELYDYNE